MNIKSFLKRFWEEFKKGYEFHSPEEAKKIRSVPLTKWQLFVFAVYLLFTILIIIIGVYIFKIPLQ